MTLSLIVLALAAVLVVLGSWMTACFIVRSDAFSDHSQRTSLIPSSTEERPAAGELVGSASR